MMFDKEYFSRYCRPDGQDWQLTARKRAYLYRAWIRRLVPYVKRCDVVLEVGCGVGFFSQHLARLDGNPRIECIDVSDAALEIACEHLSSFGNVTIALGDAEKLAYADNMVDLVVCMDVVEHLTTPEKFFSEAARVLKSDGIFFFSTPNPGSLGQRIKSGKPHNFGEKSDVSNHVWFGYRDHTHINIRTISQWRDAAKAAGFFLISDGTDFWWDTPYFSWIPVGVQKLIFNGSHRILTMFFGFLPWSFGENYYGIWRNVKSVK